MTCLGNLLLIDRGAESNAESMNLPNFRHLRDEFRHDANKYSFETKTNTRLRLTSKFKSQKRLRLKLRHLDMLIWSIIDKSKVRNEFYKNNKKRVILTRKSFLHQYNFLCLSLSLSCWYSSSTTISLTYLRSSLCFSLQDWFGNPLGQKMFALEYAHLNSLSKDASFADVVETPRIYEKCKFTP